MTTTVSQPAKRPMAATDNHVRVAGIAIGALLAFALVAPYLNMPFGATGDGNLVRQVGYAGLFIVALWAARVTTFPARLLMLPVGIGLTLAWCWISLVWAVEPSIALRRLILTTIVIFAIFFLVRVSGFERTLFSARIVLVIILVANYIASIAFPAIGVHQIAEVTDPGLIGAWRGVLIQKNFAGAACAFTIMLFVFSSERSGLNAWLRWGVAALSAYYLYRTGSKTSMGLLFVAMIAGAAYLRYDPRFRALVIPALMVGSSLFVIFTQAYWDDWLAPFDRPDAFTGRVQIWQALLAYARDNPLGSGYGSFWNIGPYSPIYQYSHSWVAKLGNGHNGYLDLLVQIGAPGLVLAVVGAIIMPLVRLLGSGVIAREKGALLVALLFFCAGHNFTETSLFERDTVVQVFLMLTIALIGEAERERAVPQGMTRRRLVARLR